MHFRRTNPLICICNITNSVCQSATWLFQHDINLSLLKKCCYINSKRVAKRELKTQRGQNIFEVVQLSQFKNHTNLEVIPHLKLVTLHSGFLEHWNSKKSVCNIWQCFSYLLDEWIAKISKKKFFTAAFWDNPHYPFWDLRSEI